MIASDIKVQVRGKSGSSHIKCTVEQIFNTKIFNNINLP